MIYTHKETFQVIHLIKTEAGKAYYKVETSDYTTYGCMTLETLLTNYFGPVSLTGKLQKL